MYVAGSSISSLKNKSKYFKLLFTLEDEFQFHDSSRLSRLHTKARDAKKSVSPQFCAYFDVLSCGVLPESGGVGTPAETSFTMGKSLKSSSFVTPDASARCAR